MSTFVFATAVLFTWLALRSEVDNIVTQTRSGIAPKGGETIAVVLSIAAIGTWIGYHGLTH